jgi:hypothetical protein
MVRFGADNTTATVKVTQMAEKAMMGLLLLGRPAIVWRNRE